MPIYERLSKIVDLRTKDDGCCTFNGYLEDYIYYVEEGHDLYEYKEVLEQMLELNHNLRIIVNLGLNVNKEVVSNRVIRYKDSFKLPQGSLLIPYMIYGHNENNEERALLLTIGDNEQYLYAKSLYLCLTEPQKDVSDDRNEVLALNIDDEILNIFKEVFVSNKKVGAIQRRLENQKYPDLEQFHEKIWEESNRLQLEIKESIKKEDAQKQIYAYIAKVYLLKKLIYVHYMMNKQLLSHLFENDVKKQRTKAKELSDKVAFIPMGQLFRSI